MTQGATWRARPPASYYAIVVDTSPAAGPVGLIRRCADVTGEFVDETFTFEDTWVPTSEVTSWYAGNGPRRFDLILVSEGEANELLSWFEDHIGSPPLIGGWSLATAWSVALNGAAPIDTLCARLNMLPHGSTADTNEHDPGFRVLCNNDSGRVSLNIYRGLSPGRWIVTLQYLRERPSLQTIDEVRNEVFRKALELGFETSEEEVRLDESVSVPLSPRLPYPSSRPEPPPFQKIFTVSCSGNLNTWRLKALQGSLDLNGNLNRDLRDVREIEFGERYLPDNRRYLAKLWLNRAEVGRDNRSCWEFGVSGKGDRPPEERIQQWISEVKSAAAEAGLLLQGEWISPTPENPTPLRNENLPVRFAYAAILFGTLMQDSLDRLRERLDMRRRGRLDDDWDSQFGTAVLRPGEGAQMTLELLRKDEYDNDWSLLLSYQGAPPTLEQVSRIRKDIMLAASDVGLTIDYESVPEGAHRWNERSSASARASVIRNGDDVR